MTKIFKIRWTNEDTDERGTSIFLAKSERHAKAIFYRFNPDKKGLNGIFQAIELKSDGVYDINMVNQLKEGDSFRLANKAPDTDAGPFWNDEYETGSIVYTKGPYDPTRRQYEVTDECGFVYYISPHELIVQIWEV